MRNLKIVFCSLLLSISAFAQYDHTPGQFDTYVFSMSYQNDFCASHPSKVECQKTYLAPEMDLHGLWPNVHDDSEHRYQYCGISNEEFGNQWCNSTTDKKREMNADTFNLLSTVMPGAQSCLYNHEWYAHGTCSGLSVDTYFQVSAQLAQSFKNLKNFNTFLTQSFGMTVSRSEIMTALKLDLGVGIESAAALQCRKSFFSEVHVTLNLANFKAFPAESSFGETESQGNCPEEGIIILSSLSSPSAGTPPPQATPGTTTAVQERSPPQDPPRK